MITYFHIMPDAETRKRWLIRYKGMVARCHNPGNKDYPRYGARGITVYTPWVLDRREFLEWVIKQPGWDNPALQLDRKDNKKGYTPSNLRFVSVTINARNRRSNTKIFYFDRLFTMAEFTERFCPGLNPGTLHRYLKRGWTADVICRHFLASHKPLTSEDLFMRESSIEGYLHQRVVDMGGTTRKYISPGVNGTADRICYFKPRQAFFIELKAPGKKEDQDQITERRRMEDLGFICFVCDSFASVDFALARIRSILAKVPTPEMLDRLEKENEQLRKAIPGPHRDSHAARVK